MEERSNAFPVNDETLQKGDWFAWFACVSYSEVDGVKKVGPFGVRFELKISLKGRYFECVGHRD
jgi:hypothetical protein